MWNVLKIRQKGQEVYVGTDSVGLKAEVKVLPSHIILYCSHKPKQSAWRSCGLLIYYLFLANELYNGTEVAEQWKYLGFLPKKPEFVFGPANRVFGVRFASLCFGGPDGAIWSCSLDVLTEVFKREINRGFKPRLERLHYNPRILWDNNNMLSMLDMLYLEPSASIIHYLSKVFFFF